MTQCWSEGELRAYLDGELPARDMERAAAHLKDCVTCGGLYAELASRAARVETLMELLPEPIAPSKVAAIPKPAAHTGRWLAAAGLAAALALALVMAPWRSRPGNREVQVKSAPAPPVTELLTPEKPLPNGRGSDRSLPSRDRQGAVRTRRAPPPNPKPRVEEYVALDDEPIEAGVVVRVGFSGGRVPADVIFGPDGRARAIRLISDISGEK
jgi:Putative zinc-finger